MIDTTETFHIPSDTIFDEPDALDNALLAEHMAQLRAGQPAHLPKYDFPSHFRLPETECVYPKPIIIIEGILVLAIPELVKHADICVFVDAPADIRLCRRLTEMFWNGNEALKALDLNT